MIFRKKPQVISRSTASRYSTAHRESGKHTTAYPKRHSIRFRPSDDDSREPLARHRPAHFCNARPTNRHIMGCSGSKEVEKAVVMPPYTRQPHSQEPTQTRTGGGQDTTTKGPTGGGNDRLVKPPPSRPRMDNNTVDFQEFKDDEKNVVETMLESNKGLRMAEINFHDLKLARIIGAGAFGEVIKGTYCGTPVVVKRMLRNKITEDNLRMFGEEIQLMMNLRHPNIVQVLYLFMLAARF